MRRITPTTCDRTGQFLRSVAVTASPSLVMTTQARVRARALHLQEQQSRMVLIAISFCIGALSSALSAWLWWRFGGWVAERLGLSPAIVRAGSHSVSWLLPAVVIAVLMLAFPRPLLEESLVTGTGEGAGRRSAMNEKSQFRREIAIIPTVARVDRSHRFLLVQIGFWCWCRTTPRHTTFRPSRVGR